MRKSAQIAIVLTAAFSAVSPTPGMGQSANNDEKAKADAKAKAIARQFEANARTLTI